MSVNEFTDKKDSEFEVNVIYYFYQFIILVHKWTY